MRVGSEGGWRTRGLLLRARGLGLRFVMAQGVRDSCSVKLCVSVSVARARSLSLCAFVGFMFRVSGCENGRIHEEPGAAG